MVLGLGATRMVVSFTVNEREDDAMTQLADRVLSIFNSCSVEPAVSVFACGAPVLGMAIHADGMGQAERHAKSDRILHPFGYPGACVERIFHFGPRVCRRLLSHSRTRFETDRAAARDRHDGCLHRRRSRGALLDLFRSR